MSLLSLPDQTIPETKKDKDWHIAHATEYATFSLSDSYRNDKQNMLKYYRAYNAELTEKDEKMVKAITCPNGINLGVDYVVYPLVQTKIEQIVGEFLMRPIRRQAYVLDKKSKNKKWEEKLKMMSEKIMRDLTEKMQPDLGFTAETEQPDIELPDDVEEFFEKDFKMIQEEVANKIISVFLDVRKEKNKLKELFIDYAITDRCHAVLDKKHGFTTMRKVHPLDADYDLDPYKTVQDDHEYFFENYWLTENEVYNTFNLSKEEKEKVKEMFEAFGSPANHDTDSDELTVTKKSDGWFQTDNKTGRIRLISAMWKSRKRVSIKVSKNKEGRTFHKKLNSEDEARKKDKVEHIDGEMPRFVVMLGPDLCLDWGVMPQRFSSVEDKYSCQLPVISIVRDNTTGTSNIKSIAAKLYQLQQIASEILFEIRLALKSAGNSRVLVYDAAQTPKDFTKGSYESGLNRVMHHIKKDKLMIINSKDKGATKNTFNQFTSLDLSQKGAIQDLFNGLAIIEDLASKFVGITPEREGQIGQYQTATGTDKAIRGSSARTEIIYTPFDEFVQVLLEKVLRKAQQDYKKGEVIHYIIGEMQTQFLRLHDDFFTSDFGLHVADSRKDKENAERINAAAEMALSNSNTPEMVMGLIEVFEGETASEKKGVFSRMLNSMQKLQAEAQEAAAAQAKAEQEAEAAKSEQELLISREGNETEVEVAKIYANNKATTEQMKNHSSEKIKAAELTEKQREGAEKSAKKDN
jgi:hypothetical protein